MGFSGKGKGDVGKDAGLKVFNQNGTKLSSDSRSTEDQSNEESKDNFGHDFLQRKRLFIEIN